MVRESSNSIEELDDDSMMCAICHSSEIISDNDLVSPCLCRGSIRWQHQKCLTQWVNTSKSLKCSICGTLFAHAPLKPNMDDYFHFVQLFITRFQEDMLVLFIVICEVLQVDQMIMKKFFGLTLDEVLYNEVVRTFLSKEHSDFLDKAQETPFFLIFLTLLRGFLLGLLLRVVHLRILPASILYFALFLDPRWIQYSWVFHAAAVLLIVGEVMRSLDSMKKTWCTFAWFKSRYTFVNREK